MSTATCSNPDCPEQGVAKTVGFALQPTDVVVCGECGRPCDITDAEPEPPPNQIDNTLPEPETP